MGKASLESTFQKMTPEERLDAIKFAIISQWIAKNERPLLHRDGFTFIRPFLGSSFQIDVMITDVTTAVSNNS